MRAERQHLTCSMRVEPGLVLVTLVGGVDEANVGQFRSMMDAAVAAVGPAATMTVDVSDLERLAGGVAVLAGAAARVLGAGGHVSVQGAHPELYHQLDAAQLVGPLCVDPPGTSTRALTQGLAGLDRSIPTRRLLDAALKLVVTMTQAVVVGADGVSITLPRNGQLETVAASNDVVLAMDHDQYDTRQGPCLDAARQGQSFHIDSLSREDRWADFVPRARARGIESILSSPLLHAQQPLGALNIYSRTVGAFAEHEKQWAHLFAAEASEVLATAQHSSDSREQQDQLAQALSSRQTIAQAQGAVMHRDALNADEAFSALRETSLRTSRPLLEVCQVLLDGTQRHQERRS
jgi:GAF domain-containing protein